MISYKQNLIPFESNLVLLWLVQVLNLLELYGFTKRASQKQEVGALFNAEQTITFTINEEYGIRYNYLFYRRNLVYVNIHFNEVTKGPKIKIQISVYS